ncbi:hypothetical protein [uncultured Deinococcus sp.]|uniref:hypothetical protein n=1 Tax=uncultured Deinococcus sp. TaxID=158789 RepID=UPI002589C9F9|nr:hypothetical protein [uncultured Deinococcus sp.]
MTRPAPAPTQALTPEGLSITLTTPSGEEVVGYMEPHEVLALAREARAEWDAANPGDEAMYRAHLGLL